MLIGVLKESICWNLAHLPEMQATSSSQEGGGSNFVPIFVGGAFSSTHFSALLCIPSGLPPPDSAKMCMWSCTVESFPH